MKAIKKLTALLLSVMMILGLVIIPSSAEEVAPQAIHDDPIITKTVNLLDFSDYALGEIEAADYPDGIAEDAFPDCDKTFSGEGGVKRIVANSDGKKVLQLDLDSVTFAKPTKNQFRLIANKYSPIYYIKLTNIPAALIPYISKVGIKMYKPTGWETEIIHEFGLSDGTNYSRLTQGSNLQYYNKEYWEKEYAISQFKKGNQWYHQGYSDDNFASRESWDNTFNTLFLALSVNLYKTTAGTLNIEEITYTYSAPKSVVDSLPITKKVNLLDMSNAEEGVMADASQYPVGVKEHNWHYNYTDGRDATFTGKGGKKSVVKNAEGKKVLQLDLTSVDFTCSSSGTYNRLGAGYDPIYYIKLTDIPTGYVPYIQNIGVKMKKSSATTKVVYELGVSDGSNYSKADKTDNQYISESNTSTVKYVIKPNDLKKVPAEWRLGANAGNNWDTYANWDNSFTTIFLALSAYNANGKDAYGTLDIEEITYTASATEEQFAAADAEWESKKSLVADFETNGTATKFAAGGEKAFYVYAQNKPTSIAISNPYIRKANGITFWVYNNGTATTTPKIGLDLTTGERYLIEKTSIPAKSYKKITIDFSRLGLDLQPNVCWWEGDTTLTRGSDVSLTAAQRASISGIFMSSGSLLDVFVDDVYLLNDPNYKEIETTEIAINADTVTGANVVDGKVVIPASAEKQVVAISVPAGTLTNASTLTYSLNSSASTEAQLNFYTNAVLDTTRKTNGGEEAFIKWAADSTRKNNRIQPGTSFSYGANFYAVDSYDGAVNIYAVSNTVKFEYPGYISNWPTASEKATATTIYLEVGAFGNADNAATDFITLDALTLVSKGVHITAATVAGGAATLTTDKAFPGATVEFFVTAYTDCILRDISVVDSTGNNIIITKSESPSGKNLGSCYTFTAPAADVTITPRFSMINKTFSSTTAYDADNFNISFTTPVVDGKGYNQKTGDFDNFVNCGVIVAPVAALEKYGYSESDLTTENIKNWVATGHHLAKYVVSIDGTDILNTEEEIENIEIEINFTDVSIAARRVLSTCIISYANFADDEGNATGSVSESSSSPLDYFAYGEAFSDSFYMGKGINYSGSEATSDPAKMKEIYDNGFDFIRLPMWITLDENNQVAESALKGYDVKIENALKLGMSVIADLHVLKDSQGNKINISADYAGNVQKYYDAWDVIAEYYAAYPNSVAFQLVNEPRTDLEGNNSITDEEIMEFQSNIVTAIRKIPGNKERKIVIGSDVNYPLNMKDRFTESLLADKNIIIDFHYYTPMDFTHSGATWILNDDGSFFYPEGATLDSAGVDFNAMRNTMASIDAFRLETGVEVFMGEWGAYNPNYDDKITYYAEMVKAMDGAGIPWAVWGYSEPFSGYVNGEWDETLLDIYAGNYDNYLQQ